MPSTIGLGSVISANRFGPISTVLRRTIRPRDGECLDLRTYHAQISRDPVHLLDVELFRMNMLIRDERLRSLAPL